MSLGSKTTAKRKITKKGTAKREAREAPDFAKLISRYRTHPEDSGSIQVQVVLLSRDIAELAKHLRRHRKDFDSKRSLLRMIGKRRRFLGYLARQNEEVYRSLTADLGLRP